MELLKNPKFWTALGCISSFLAIALGAFGAHGLSEKLTEKYMAVYQTGVQYHLFHSLTLLAFSFWMRLQAAETPGAEISIVPAIFFVIGIFLFSGSLYTLAITGISKLGMITPLGGLSFLIGWAYFAWVSLK